jgi:dCMP deaminase
MSDKWDKRFIELAKHVASWSKDRTKVGAVIVDPVTKHVVSMGYNGFPRGVEDTDERLQDRDTKLKLTCHAEVNAILSANQVVRGCHIYIYPTFMVPTCCHDCAKAIIQSGITRVVGYSKTRHSDTWAQAAEFSKILLDEAGVVYENKEIE